MFICTHENSSEGRYCDYTLLLMYLLLVYLAFTKTNIYEAKFYTLAFKEDKGTTYWKQNLLEKPKIHQGLFWCLLRQSRTKRHFVWHQQSEDQRTQVLRQPAEELRNPRENRCIVSFSQSRFRVSRWTGWGEMQRGRRPKTIRRTVLCVGLARYQTAGPGVSERPSGSSSGQLTHCGRGVKSCR